MLRSGSTAEEKEKKLKELNREASAFEDAGKYEEALKKYQEMVTIDSKYVGAYWRISDIYCSQGKYQEAMTASEQAIELAPEKPFAYEYKAIALSHAGKMAMALEFYNKAISLVKPNSPYMAQLLGNKSITLIKLVRYQEALEALGSAMAIKAQDGDLHYHRALCLSNLGRYEEALESYDLASNQI